MQMTEERSIRQIKPTVLDIFCGAGGMSLGFKNAGCKILGGIDQNPHAIATHHQNFPTAKLKLPPQDICSLDFNFLNLNIGEVDIIVGGPPCQVFSRVGIGKMKKLGRDIETDHRNFLYKEFVRFVSYYKPLCFVMENVDYLANRKDKISRICQDFIGKGRLDYPGYVVDFQVLDASEFGVPQKRKRLFIVGIRSDLGMKPPFPSRYTEIPVTVKEAICDLPNLQPLVTPLKAKSSGPKQKDIEIDYKSSPQFPYQKKMRQNKEEGEKVWNHICRSHNDKDIIIFEVLDQGKKYLDVPKEMRRYRSDIFEDKYKRLHWDEPSWTLTAHMRKDGLAYIHPSQARSISVREAATPFSV